MTNQTTDKIVAVIDDDESVRMVLREQLRSADLLTLTFASAEDFLKSREQQRVGCLIADISMPGMSGLELQVKLNAQTCRIPTIFITAHGDEQLRMRALRAGAVELLAKPRDVEVLLEKVRSALEASAE